MYKEVDMSKESLMVDGSGLTSRMIDVEALKSILKVQTLSPKLLDAIEKLNASSKSILIVEGITILNDPKLFSMFDLKLFIKIDKDVCWERRKNRVLDPDGSCWEESPGYFNAIAWPEYTKIITDLEGVEGDIQYLDSNCTSIEDNASNIISAISETFD